MSLDRLIVHDTTIPWRRPGQSRRTLNLRTSCLGPHRPRSTDIVTVNVKL